MSAHRLRRRVAVCAQFHCTKARVARAGTWLLLVFTPYLAHAQPGDWLYLSFDPDQVRLESDGTVAQTQSLRGGSSPKACQMKTDNKLIRFSATTSKGSAGIVGFKSDDNLIGQQSGTGGQPCGRVRDKETLTLKLGTDLAARQMVGATLNIVIRNRTRIQVTTHLAGQIVGAFEVRSGNYQNLNPVNPASETINCSTTNCQVVLQGERWDEIRLRTDNLPKQPGAAGEWSIGGGDSSFELSFSSEGDLDCGDIAVEENASLRRLDDAVNDSDSCTAIPHRLDFDGQTLTFLADYGSIPDVEPAFAFEVTWLPEFLQVPGHAAVPYLGTNPPAPGATFLQGVPLSVQWFEDPNNKYFLDLCPGQPQYDDDDLLTDVELPGDFNDSEDGPNDMSDLPGFQYGCLIERSVEVVPDSDSANCPIAPEMTGADAVCVEVRESGYLRGDWRATRTL